MRLALVLLLVASIAANCLAAEPPQPPEGEMLILSVGLGGDSLADGLIGYSYPDHFSLPFTQLMEALNIPIKMQREPGVASGWFLSPGQGFILDVPNRLLSVNGRKVDADWSRIIVKDGDIYVDSASIKAWLGLKFQVVTSQMEIRLDPDQELPLIDQIKRHRKWHRLTRPTGLEEDSDLPVFEPPYAWVDWPAIDNNLRWRLNHNDGGTERVTEYDLLATGDFLHMTGALSANVYGSSSGESHVEKRLQLRNSPDQGAPRVVLGDYTMPVLPLVLPQQQGVGLMLGSFRQTALQQFSTITLQGDALNGWDVELYQNGELIDFVTVRDDNHFEFRDVPLRYGVNLFHMVLYGPQGQIRERVARYYVGPEMNRSGESTFRAALQRTDKALLGDGPENSQWMPTEQGEGLSGYLSYSYGFSNNLSLSAHLASTPLGQERHDYGGLQVQTNINNAFYDLLYMDDRDGGWAGSLNVQTHAAGSAWSFGHDQYADFSSPSINSSAGDSALTQTSRIRWNRKLPMNMAAAAQVAHRRTSSGSSATESAFRLSGRLRHVTVSDSIGVQTQSGQTPRYSGVLLGNFHTMGFKASGQLRYGISPVMRLDSSNVTGIWSPGGAVNYRANVQSYFTDLLPNSYSLGMFFRLEPMTLSLSGTYSEDGHYSINLDLFSALERMNGTWFASRRPKSQYGSAVARVYVDNNGNQQFDPDDEAIEGARFRMNSGGAKGMTDKSGLAYLRNIPTEFDTTIGINEGSLRNPFWVALRPKYRVNMRPGKTVTLDFPVVFSGEIDGTIYLKEGEAEPNPASNVVVQVFSASDELIREVHSAYDGFYLLDKLRPGRYILRLNREQLQRVGLSPNGSGERRLVIEGNGDIKSGVDFVLRRSSGPRDVAGADGPGDHGG
jgi:hypothetical protein